MVARGLALAGSAAGSGYALAVPVVSLIGFLPPERFDTIPWNRAKIDEAAGPDGPWVTLETQALAPLDVDPRVPALRNFTTTLAALTGGWYRITFLDAGGGQSLPTIPTRNSADETLPPSPEAVRNASPLLRSKYPLPPTDSYAMADLRNLVAGAVAYAQRMTFRLIDPALGCAAPEDYVCEDVPDALAPVAFEVVARLSERVKVTTDPVLAEQIATGRRLRGFSAGPYSESYFAPGEFARRGVVGRPAMDPDDVIDQLLWALATEDARDYFVFRASGVAPPTGVATAFDYRRQSIGYGHSGGRGYGAPLDLGHGGPDGF